MGQYALCGHGGDAISMPMLRASRLCRATGLVRHLPGLLVGGRSGPAPLAGHGRWREPPVADRSSAQLQADRRVRPATLGTCSTRRCLGAARCGLAAVRRRPRSFGGLGLRRRLRQYIRRRPDALLLLASTARVTRNCRSVQELLDASRRDRPNHRSSRRPCSSGSLAPLRSAVLRCRRSRLGRVLTGGRRGEGAAVSAFDTRRLGGRCAARQRAVPARRSRG